MNSTRIGKVGMDTTIKQMSVALVSLAAVLAAPQGKAEGEISYDAVTVRGRIENAVLSDDGKWFASKTTGAKIGDTEYAGWVGNTDNLNAQFSSDCLKDVASLAFFKNKLYVALNNKTNGLLRIDVGNGQLPNLKTAKFIKFDSNGTTAMQAPYLYATTNNLYAIDDNQILYGMKNTIIFTLNKKDDQSLNLLNTVSYYPLRRRDIKDIVSKNINNQDCLYILTTNGSADLHFINPKVQYLQNNYTPLDWYFDGGFDYTTSITIHEDNVLSTNAHTELGYMTPIKDDGRLASGYATSEPFYPSDTGRTSAIGSDGQNYYAQESDTVDPTKKRFINGIPKICNDLSSNEITPSYQNKSPEYQGQDVFKIIVREGGKEAYGVAPDRIYRINRVGR